MPLKVVIAGAGIAGLIAAIGFARHGHEVLLLEKRSGQDKDLARFGAAVQLQPNAVKVLRAWAMMDELLKVGHLSDSIQIRQVGQTVPIGLLKFKARGEALYILRADLRNVVRTFAVEAGATILDGAKVESVDLLQPAVVLEDGSRHKADLVIGADGTFSKVRGSLFPASRPTILPHCTFQVTVPLNIIEKSASTRALTNGSSMIVHYSPDRAIVSSPVPNKDIYDLQCIDLNYHSDPDSRNERVRDLNWLRNRYSDYEDGVKQVLDHADSCWKWHIAEVTDLTSWSSPDGKVVLIGDAAHSMRPYSGQGSAMGIEDGAVLSEILAQASPGDDFAPLVKRFEKHRMYRCAKIHKFATFNGYNWGAKTEETIEKRNQFIRQRSAMTEFKDVSPDAEAPWSAPEFTKYMDSYDCFDEASKLLNSRSQVLGKL